MEKTRSKSFKITLIILLILGIIGTIWAKYYSPPTRQSQNLAIADQFVERKLTPLVIKNDKFKNIKLGHYTGNGGCIWILGEVETKKNLMKLKQLVNSSNPPLEVKWNVQVWEILAEKYKEKTQDEVTPLEQHSASAKTTVDRSRKSGK